MKIVGCDLHARQQSIAMVDTETGVLTEKLLKHEGNAVREFYTSGTKAPRVRGCTPTCIAKKAIRTTQPTGMVGHGSPFAENHSMRNGSASSEICWDRASSLFL